MALAMLIVFSVLFALTHLVLSHGAIRESLVKKLGEWPFRGLYSAAALATLGGAVALFIGHPQAGAELWDTPGWLYPLVYALMLLAFLLLTLMLANPSPAGMMPARTEPRGVLRVTRHPMNMGVASFALAHFIANGRLGALFFFGSLFLVGFFGAYHQDRRKARERGDEFAAFRQQTSILPFAAVITGKTRLEPGEFSLPLIAIAVIAFAAVLFLHSRIFGLAPW